MENDKTGPFKVVKTNWNVYFCEGPYQSGNQWKSEEKATEECNLLNSVYMAGFREGINCSNAIKEELESDIANAYRCAQEYRPDYPWDDTQPTASQAVWACGEGYKGVDAACEDWRRLFKHLAPEAYNLLMELPVKESMALRDRLEKEEKEKKN